MILSFTHYYRKITCTTLIAILSSFVSFKLHAQTSPAVQWDKSYGSSRDEVLFSILPTADGGFLLGGETNASAIDDITHPSHGGTDIWIVKIDSVGNKIWDRMIGGNYGDHIRVIKHTLDGNYIIGGYSDSDISGDKSQSTSGNSDYWILKIDQNGNKIWDRTFGGNYSDELQDLEETSDGGFILGGYSTSDLSGDKTEATQGFNDYWIVKTDANGNKLWDRSFGGNGHDYLFTIKQTPDGGYILGGSSDSYASGDKTQSSNGAKDFWLIKLDANGNKIWDKTLGGNLTEYFTSLQLTDDSGYILAGSSDSNISQDKSQDSKGGFDYWIIKVDQYGNKLWDKTYGGNNDDYLNEIRQTKNSEFIVAGSSSSVKSGDKSQNNYGANPNSNTYQDYWILKLKLNGDNVWDKTIGGKSFEFLNSIEQLKDGSFVLGGISYSEAGGDKSQNVKGFSDFWIIKLEADNKAEKENDNNFEVKTFPNPIHRKLPLKISGLQVQKVEVKIIDLLGQVVFNQELQVKNSELSETLNLPVSRGLYLIQIKAGSTLITDKIIVE